MTGSLPPARWNGLVIALHWLAGALILFLLAQGWIMIHGGFGAATTFDLYQLHKSFGFVVLALTAARLLARAAFTAPAAAPKSAWEQRLAAFVQASLYALTLAAILAGWLVVSTSPLPIPTRFFDLFVIPNIAAPDGALFASATLAHALSAYAVAGLVALHIAGALKHHVVDRDDVLTRMLPRRSSPFSLREKGRG
ncbi:MAG: cytochrome b [Hyphomicrobiales bacterium]|nr:cytochrome b [Hyphomicrobiales bacterium]